MGVPEHFIALIRSLYGNKEAAIRTEYDDTEWFEVRNLFDKGASCPPTYSTCTVKI
jgi:hypothetical protein